MDKIDTPSGYGAEQLAGGGRGKSRVRLALLAVAALCGAAAIYWACRPGPPVYKGRPITAWFDDWAATSRNWSGLQFQQRGTNDYEPVRQAGANFSEAIRHAGTNVLPYAVRNLALNDSRLRTNYVRLQPKLPGLLRRIFRNPKPLLNDVDGANVFFDIGNDSIPYAIALLRHESPTVRRSAAFGLEALRRKSPAAGQAIPALIQALGDDDASVRLYVAKSLSQMGADASNAVPPLTRLVANTNENPWVRTFGANALGSIGVSARSALPALTNLAPSGTNAIPAIYGTLEADDNALLRGEAAFAVWRISSNADYAVAILLQEMSTNVYEIKRWEWVKLLGKIGPQAKAAIPQLRRELQRDHSDFVLRDITNALRNIGSEDAGVENK